MNQYLIPANSKKSMLIFGVFNQFDLVLFLCGIGATLLLLMLLPVDELLFAIVAIIPGGIASLLVMPIPNYHNVMTFIKIAFKFYTTRQHFVWRGWCFANGKDYDKE